MYATFKMRPFPKQICEESFKYSSTLTVDELSNEIKQVLSRSKELNFKSNLSGILSADNSFSIFSKWQIVPYSTLNFHTKTTIEGQIYKISSTGTQVNITVKPNSMFPTFFFILPLFYIVFFLTLEDSQRIFEVYLLFIALMILTPTIILFLSALSKNRLKGTFARQFNLTEINS